jgi:uncharacterized protein (TIGR03437 family)
MQYSIHTNSARVSRWNRASLVRLATVACVLSTALCRAQTPPVFTITTIAGTGPGSGITSAGYTGDGGAATSAELHGPTGVVLDSSNNLYIADQANNVIRKVSGGNISTVAGVLSTTGSAGTAGYSGDGGQATIAEINFPDSLAVDSKGNFYFSDVLNGAVRMVNSSGVISTFAGSSAQGSGFSGDGGLATNASLDKPAGLTIDSAGNVYIADSGNFRIREVTASNGDINSIAGTGNEGFYNGGGVATAAHLDGTREIAIDAAGDLYLADSINNEVRKVVISSGAISTVAGSAAAMAGFSGDEGLATNALLNHPDGVAVDSAGNLYICDTFNQRIRMVTPDGNIHTIAGTGAPGFSGDGGAALSAQFDEPVSLSVDAAGNLYVADLGNNVIRKLTPSSGPGKPPAAPLIRSSNGVISASDFGALSSVAPGSWIEIYGSNLAPATRSWCLVPPATATCKVSDFTGIEAPTALNLTNVSVDGKAAFIEYISPTQVNAQVPGTVGLGSKPVTVSTPAGTSPAFSININLQEPGLYAPAPFQIVGKQYVGALFTDLTTYVFPTGSFSGIASRPAKSGDTIVLYGIGFGPVPGNPPGQIPQAANGLTLPILPKFYFGGVEAQVTYAGLAPSFIGLYQFNVVVPAVAASDAVPLTFTVNINGSDVAGTQTLYTAVQN